ncbi:MAG: sigma-70 family RNA polymerase sigma factor [Bacteriovoracaceae bacterium]
MNKKEREFFNSKDFLGRLRNKDSTAIEAMVMAYTEHLYRAGLGMGFNENAAKELAQNTWVSFYDAVGNFQGNSHVRTFLFGILYNKARELRREEAKVQKHDSIEEIMEAKFDEKGRWTHPPMEPDRFMEASETMEIIEACAQALPITQRSAFYLKFLEEESTPEICKILDVTVTNLGVLLYRAKNKLRECIEAKAKGM